jgi:hypothetical protein
VDDDSDVLRAIERELEKAVAVTLDLLKKTPATVPPDHAPYPSYHKNGNKGRSYAISL